MTQWKKNIFRTDRDTYQIRGKKVDYDSDDGHAVVEIPVNEVKLAVHTDEYPPWICTECGIKYGSAISGHLSTYHEGVCGWCEEQKAVTEPRDFRYPPAPKK